MGDYLAQNNDEGTYTPEQLLAGEAPITTQGGYTVITGQNLARLTVVGEITASGKLTAWDPAAADGSEVPCGILIEAIDATAADKDGASIYTGGIFNHEVLVWPAAIDTYLERRQAFGPGSTIKIGKLQG